MLQINVYPPEKFSLNFSYSLPAQTEKSYRFYKNKLGYNRKEVLWEMSENKELLNNYAVINSCFNTNQTSVVENRLEVLTALSKSLLQEIEALRQGELEVLNEKIDFAEEVQRFEENLIRSALIKSGGRQRRAAKLLNLKASTLNSKIKRFGIL